MGPKARKSPARSKSPKKQDLDVSFYSAPLNEENWSSLIALLAPTDALEELYLEQLEKSVKTGSRRRFTWLSKKELLEIIIENSNKKGGAPKKSIGVQVPLPQAFLAAIELAKPYIDNKEEIPDNLMAQLIKGKLVHIKLTEKEKESLRLSRTDKRQSQSQLPKTAKKEKSPTGKKSPTKTAATGKKAAQGPLPEIEKQSQLKKKEDIEEEQKYLDDEPKDGPNHYIILTGFYSPALFQYIDEFNIAIDCLLRFKSNNHELINKFMFEIEDREKLETNLKSNLKLSINESEKSNSVNTDTLSEERRSNLLKLRTELGKFWTETNSLLEKPQDKLIQHIGRLKFNLKQEPEFKSWFDLEARTDFGNKMFEQLADKMYSLVTQKRQYGFYINNLKLFSIPCANPILNYPSQESVEMDKFYDMRYYNELLDTLPAEYLNTSIVLYSMIEQVAVNEEKEKNPVEIKKEENLNQIPNLSKSISDHFEKMIQNLALTDQDKKNLTGLLPFEENKQQQTKSIGLKKKTSSLSPYLINYNDENGSRLKGLFEEQPNKKASSKPLFDPIKIENEMLSKSLWTTFTGLPNVSTKLAKQRAARLQELLHFLTQSPEITNADVDRALKQFVFETMSLTDVNKKSYINKPSKNLIIPWDDPYPNISEILSEEQQVFLKSLNKLEAKELNEENKKKSLNNRISSASTTKSIKFQDETDNKESLPSSILKSRPSTKLSDILLTATHSIEFVQSVHFPDTFDLNQQELASDLNPPKSIDQTVDLINSTKKRDLTDWIYAEHYEPNVLVQMLQKVSYTHPYVDSYYNRRDDSLMLVFSNPYDEETLSNHEESVIKLHSNVGFRNYLEKIYDMIVDWTRDEEAKYQASLVAKEVDKFRSESTDSLKKDLDSTSRSSSKGSKKRTPSPNKKAKKEEKLSSPIVDESEYISDKFVSHNSLKAWKIEHDKQVQEQVKQAPKTAKPKSPKRSPENPKKPDSARPKSSSGSKSPLRDGSAKSKKSLRSTSKNKIVDKTEPTDKPKTVQVQKANNSFIGYQIGNNMIYVKIHQSHMFPFNGGLIRTERINFKTSSNLHVKTSVIKDGHTFSIHLIDPKLEDSENDLDNSKIAKYSCFTGVFQDGLSLSVSTPIQLENKKQVKEPVQNPEPVPQLTPQQSQEKLNEEGKLGKKAATAGKKGAKKGEITPEPIKPKVEEKKVETELTSTNNPVETVKEEPKPQVLPWTQLYLSTPNGLSCTFIPETYSGVLPLKDNEPHRLTVKQSFTTNSSLEKIKNVNINLQNEKSRLIKSDGTVLKFMHDNTIEVLYSNGSIYRKVNEITLESDLETIKVNKKQSPRGVENKITTKYLVLTPSGNEYLIDKENNNSFKLNKFYRSIQEHDCQTDETMITREDNLKIVYRPDGSRLVDFQDGTRITTFYLSSANTARKDKFVKIECPGYATTIFNCKTTECTLALGSSGTIIGCDPKKMSYNLIYSNGEQLDVSKDGSVVYTPKNGNHLAKKKFIFNQTNEFILEHEDEVGNKFRVNKNGKNVIYAINGNKKRPNLIKTYNKHSPRFFIIHKDSSGTELLRQEDVNDYLAEVEIDPMTAIIRDNIQGYPNIMGTTVLRPLRNSLTDYWISDYDEKDITPFGLRSRNLMSFPTKPEIKVPGKALGTNIGKGLHIDLNSNKRVKNPPMTIARRMEYRQLIEYQKLTDEVKSKLILGLKNYMIYIAQRAETHRLLLTHDPQLESEKLTAFKILELAGTDRFKDTDVSEIYKNIIKSKNSYEHLSKNIKNINKLLLNPNNLDEKKKKLEQELKKEKINKEAWRKSFVPSYFNSEWGKEFLNSLKNSNKENLFLTQSDNEFNQDSSQLKQKNEPPLTRTESKQSKKYLPPVSFFETDYSNDTNHKNNIECSNIERYQPKFKYLDKLDSNKVPNSIKTTRPNAVPNAEFLQKEEPVRRKVNNSIVNAAQLNGKSFEKRRGLEIYPKEIKFGILREGFTYLTEFEMINVGIDQCRFKLKQPPPETGLKLMFKPGPIAAGMTRDFSVMLLAIYKIGEETEQVYPKLRKLRHDLEIVTETDIIKIPIEADVASIEEFRNMYRGNLEAGKEKHVRILSVRPGSTREVLTKPFNFNFNKSVKIENEEQGFKMNESNEI